MVSKEHRLAEILVHYCHEKVLHRGIKQTLNELRTGFWITQGRSYIKKIINPCVTCRRLNTRSYEYPEHSDLPKFRFDDAHAFRSSAIDFLGPLFCLPVYGISS